MSRPSTPNPAAAPVPPSPSPCARSDKSVEPALNIQQRVWEAGLNILGTLLSTDPAALDLPDMRAYIDQAMGRWDPQVVSRQQWLAGAQDLLQRQQDRLLKIEERLSQKQEETNEMTELLTDQANKLESRQVVLARTREELHKFGKVLP